MKIDNATLARRAQFTPTDFALRQQVDGDVILNAPHGQDVYVLNNGGGAAVARKGR